MINKFKIVGLTFIAGCLLSTTVSNTVMAGDEMSLNNRAKLFSNSDTTTELIDKYVYVEDNEFVLAKRAHEILPVSIIDTVEARLSKVNTNIKNDDLIIDPNTKEIINYSLYTMLAASVSGANRLTSGCYVRAFWWGVRVYFTSNSAVSWFRGKLSTASGIATISAMTAHVTGHEIAGTLGDALGMYADSMSNRLYNYNNKHRHSKIYMDVNYTSVYSLHTF